MITGSITLEVGEKGKLEVKKDHDFSPDADLNFPDSAECKVEDPAPDANCD